MIKYKSHILFFIPLFLIGASECEAELNLPYMEVPISYQQCTERALLHPNRMPPLVEDHKFHAICDDGKEVFVVCYEESMVVTKRDKACSVKKAWDDYEFAVRHGILER